MRQAYDYWQDQPGSIPRRRRHRTNGPPGGRQAEAGTGSRAPVSDERSSGKTGALRPRVPSRRSASESPSTSPRATIATSARSDRGGGYERFVSCPKNAGQTLDERGNDGTNECHRCRYAAQETRHSAKASFALGPRMKRHAGVRRRCTEQRIRPTHTDRAPLTRRNV